LNTDTEGPSLTDRRCGFSVVVCTRNREHFLARALESLLTQQYPRNRYEVIVVDNASSDGTRTLVQQYVASAAVSVSYHLEHRPGTSFARNLGAAHARLEYVAYLDDDACAAPGWLAAYDAAIREYSIIAAGGPVEPVLDSGVVTPDWWLDDNLKAIFGLDHSHLRPTERVFPIRWPLWLGGCNCVYSKRLIDESGGFRTDFGPVGERYRVAEDIDLNGRLERAGVPIHYVRDARIEHTITADRLARRYILMRSFSAGITNGVVTAVLGGSSPAAGLSRLPRAALRLLLSRRHRRMAAWSALAYEVGYARQTLGTFIRSGLRVNP
jgi:glycosyltransferase involved in cell wall biosynthesis